MRGEGSPASQSNREFGTPTLERDPIDQCRARNYRLMWYSTDGPIATVGTHEVNFLSSQDSL